MVIYCVAYGCYNCENRKKPKPGKRVSFHRLPFSDPDLLTRWIKAINRADLPLSNSTLLCSEHFEPSCLTRSLGGTRRRLRPGSVPSRFNFDRKLSKPTTKKLAFVEGESECGFNVACGHGGGCACGNQRTQSEEDYAVYKCGQIIKELKEKIEGLKKDKRRVLYLKQKAETMLQIYF
ncbi:THAP domain-containing protein 3-like [Haliotis cracherodii]|uniref:THAP domain-containing protein 3-like n=1 Tax=Haliotis cracherodii TaxID=6455 RepID=UPI0039E84097